MVAFVFAKHSRVSRISGSRETGVLVAKRRTVVTFGFAPGLRALQVSTVTGMAGGPGRQTQNCRHFWTCVCFSRFESVNRHRDLAGVLVAMQNCRRFWTWLRSSQVLASQKRPPSQGRAGSWLRKAELSSLLEVALVLASQKCQQSQGSGGERRDERG